MSMRNAAAMRCSGPPVKCRSALELGTAFQRHRFEHSRHVSCRRNPRDVAASTRTNRHVRSARGRRHVQQLQRVGRPRSWSNEWHEFKVSDFPSVACCSGSLGSAPQPHGCATSVARGEGACRTTTAPGRRAVCYCDSFSMADDEEAAWIAEVFGALEPPWAIAWLLRNASRLLEWNRPFRSPFAAPRFPPSRTVADLMVSNSRQHRLQQRRAILEPSRFHLWRKGG